MKVTKTPLKQIIKEELEDTLEEAERTAKGNITQDTREKHATVGKDKFPIFDKKSAEAAIDLRGHAPKQIRRRLSIRQRNTHQQQQRKHAKLTRKTKNAR